MTARVLLWACSIVLLGQSLAPPGYMPGSLANGWPVVLCPEGLPAGFFIDAPGVDPGQGHHHHVGSGAGAADSESTADGVGHAGADAHAYCPLGSALDQPALTTASTPAAVTSELPLVLQTNLYARVNTSRYSRFHPRDPPQPIV